VVQIWGRENHAASGALCRGSGYGFRRYAPGPGLQQLCRVREERPLFRHERGHANKGGSRGERCGLFEHQHNRLALNRRSDVAVFRYDYIFFYTDRGVFGCTQYAQPTFTMNPSDKKPVDWSHAQVSAIDFERAADVVVFLEERRLWADGEADFHWLLADTQGNAFIIEPGADDNHILPGEGGFTVMTNFFHHYLEDGFAQKFAENYPGADLLDLLDHDGRYRRGAALIRSSLDHFDHLKGLEVLKAMSSPHHQGFGGDRRRGAEGLSRPLPGLLPHLGGGSGGGNHRHLHGLCPGAL